MKCHVLAVVSLLLSVLGGADDKRCFNYVSYSLNSLKGGYIGNYIGYMGNYIGDYYRGY